MKQAVVIDAVEDQEFRRVVGKRERPRAGEIPSAAAREAMARMAS